MRRWAIFFLLLLGLLAQSYPLAAKTNSLLYRQVQFYSAAGIVPDDPMYTPCPMSATHSSTGPTLVSKTCADGSPLATLAELVQASDLIVRGQVTALHSFWNADHTLIESDATIAVTYGLLGSAPRTMTVRTAGGFVASDGLGMVSMHEATWAVGEEILAFVYRQDVGWRMVGGAAGKFLVEQETVLNQDLALSQPLAELLPTVIDLIKQRGHQAQVPLLWRHLTTPNVVTFTAAAPQTDIRKWTTPHAAAAFTIHLNTTQVDGEQGSRANFYQAIINAANSWSQVPGVDFTLTYAGETNATQTGYNGVNEVLFMHKGKQERAAAAQVWFTADGTIIEADIWINDDYRWNATGNPAADEVDLQSALLHEFGHWLILGHYADSHAVMFAKLTAGTLKRELQPSDMLGIRAIYPQ